MSPRRLVGLTLGEGPEPWRTAGFDVDDEGVFTVGTLLFHASGTGDGIQAWTLSDDGGVVEEADIDGLATRTVPRIGPAPHQRHDNRAMVLDHLVIGSPNLDRTMAAFEARLGLIPRKQTEHELYGRPMVQSFFLLPPTLLEVISRPDEAGDGPAKFWGLAFATDDIEATAAGLGSLCSAPKPAVQRGRRIATLDHEAAGLSTPVAFLSRRWSS